MSPNITPLYFLSSNIIYFGQKQLIKVQIFEIFECLGQNLLFLMSVLNWQVNSFSNCVSFFIVIMRNSPVSFKLIHFVLFIKRPNESPNSETFMCSGENFLNSSWHFPNHKSVFIQILHHILVSWNITPLYFFRSNVIYFAQKEPIKVQPFQTFKCSDQNSPNSCHFWKKKIAFSSNFASVFSIMRHNSSVPF